MILLLLWLQTVPTLTLAWDAPSDVSACNGKQVVYSVYVDDIYIPGSVPELTYKIANPDVSKVHTYGVTAGCLEPDYSVSHESEQTTMDWPPPAPPEPLPIPTGLTIKLNTACRLTTNPDGTQVLECP